MKFQRNRRHFHNFTLTYVRHFVTEYPYKMPFDHDLQILLIASILQANFGWIYYFSKFSVLKNRKYIQNGMAIFPQGMNDQSHFVEIFQYTDFNQDGFHYPLCLAPISSSAFTVNFQIVFDWRLISTLSFLQWLLI